MQVNHVNSADGTPLRLGRWGDSNRDVLLVHGLAEHAGRYEYVAEKLVAAGYRVTLVELRGHGRSGGQRGHVERWRRYNEDLWAAAATLGEAYAIVAHSMGGLVAVDALREARDPPLVGIALSNPMHGLRVKTSAGKLFAAKILSRLLPTLPLKNELDANLLTHDKDIVRAYQTDPLVFGTITTRWAMEAQAAMARVPETMKRATAPLLLQLGDEDQICDPIAAAEAAKSWAGPVTTRHYPHGYHEIYNELNRDEILGDLVSWLGGLSWDLAEIRTR